MTSAPAARRARGFTLIELMIVVVIIGLLSSLAIPRILRMAAKAQRTEMVTVLEKVRMYFINQYRNTGSYGTAVGLPNPPVAAGLEAEWNKDASLKNLAVPVAGWADYTFPPDGMLRMRYEYTASDQTLVLKATGQLQGMDTAYTYQEFYTGETLTLVVEVPEL